MKDFMMIFVGQNYEQLGLSPEEMQVSMGKWMAWGEKMEKQGILKGGHALTADIKRVSGQKRTITDGPFAESKEIVGGYYIVTANNMEEVVKIAEDYPDYQGIGEQCQGACSGRAYRGSCICRGEQSV